MKVGRVGVAGFGGVEHVKKVGIVTDGMAVAIEMNMKGIMRKMRVSVWKIDLQPFYYY